MRVFSSPPGLRLSHLSNGLLAVTLTVARFVGVNA